MKVLHIISGLRGGGAEHLVLSLCRQSLKQKDIVMNVLTLSAADDISHKFREAGIDVISTSSSQKNRRSTNALKAFHILLKHPRTIFHAHMFHACITACFAKLLRPSSKIVFTLHNNHVPQFHRRLLLFVTRPLRNRDIIFPGMTRKWYQKSNAAVIPNGIDVSRFNHHTDKPPVFTCAFVGRLSKEKNPLFLIELAKSLLPEHNFVFRVAGEGPEKRRLEELIVHENLQDHFKVHGYADDVSLLLAESHCLLIPSHWEGMPLVLLEAAAAGIPVIATPVGNIPAILNNENGYMGDSNAFKEMVIDVMDNYGTALIKARRLMHDVADRYGIENIYRLHREIYQDLLV